MVTETQKALILECLAPFDPEYVGVFGSYARGEAHDASDLDILVKFRNRLTLPQLIHLEQKLTELLSVEVDLVTENALSPHIREFVQRDLKLIA